jgi:ribosomal protein L16 Arg81 hydroxylase
MLIGLHSSRCKVLVAGPDGGHREVLLPAGDNGWGLDGTRCYMNLEAAAPALKSLLKPVGVQETDIDRVNAYVSQRRSGAPLHFDSRTVWIIQLVGSKLWAVSKSPAVQNPHRNCVAPSGARWLDYDGRRLDVPTDFLFAVLRPGDWLRIPRAVWHATFSVEGSISATLAAPPNVD